MREEFRPHGCNSRCNQSWAALVETKNGKLALRNSVASGTTTSEPGSQHSPHLPSSLALQRQGMGSYYSPTLQPGPSTLGLGSQHPSNLQPATQVALGHNSRTRRTVHKKSQQSRGGEVMRGPGEANYTWGMGVALCCLCLRELGEQPRDKQGKEMVSPLKSC